MARSIGVRESIPLGMGKLTKRDIVVAISNQTGMVQSQVFEVVQRTLRSHYQQSGEQCRGGVAQFRRFSAPPDQAARRS